MTPEKERERSAKEEAIVQAISLGALVLAAALVPMVERMMSDPDISYRMRWHGRRVIHVLRLRLHELDIAIETAVGIYLIEENLRRKWRQHGEQAPMGTGDSGDTGVRPE